MVAAAAAGLDAAELSEPPRKPFPSLSVTWASACFEAELAGWVDPLYELEVIASNTAQQCGVTVRVRGLKMPS
jgi:hypothetical protein